ncbi:MAG: hypothetical protein KKA31_00205 [Candidatus Margulisbacteria bacterium]|nr:hypothetical protein [Candidatus Margulisiibacteriota bacterium]
MKITSQKREENRFTIEVEEDYSSFLKAIDQAFAQASKEIRVPGFRQGKAPRDLIEKAVNRDVIEARAAQDLISDIYPKIVDELKFDPVDYPNVEILQQEKDKPFKFRVAVDVYPEVKLGKFKGLKVDKKKVEVAEEEVLKVLGNLHDRLSQAGPEGQSEKKPLDDEFAKKVSGFGTLAELKQEISQSLLKQRESEVEADVKNKLISQVSSEAKLSLPAAMIDHEIDLMLDELKGSLAQSGLTLDGYLKGIKKEMKTLRDELRKSAEIRARGKLVLRAVAEEEKITVSDDEAKEELKAMAIASGRDPNEFEKEVDPVARKFIDDYVLRRKALDFILEKASIKLVESKKEENK